MELQYKPVLNQGNEAFNVGQSISAEEAPRGTVSYDDIASHMHEKNRLIPVELAKMVLEMQPEVEMHFIAQGFRVPRFYNGKQISQAYADVKLKKNISLAAVQAIDPSIQTLTKENIRRFVKDEDLVIPRASGYRCRSKQTRHSSCLGTSRRQVAVRPQRYLRFDI